MPTHRSNWTQTVRNASITKDFAATQARRAARFRDNKDPVQCCKCKDMHDSEVCAKLPGSNLRVCDDCHAQES